MTCEELIGCLSDYIDNELDAGLMEAAREHLRTCPNCPIVLDSTQKMILLYRQQNDALQIPLHRRKGLFEELSKAFAAQKKD